MKGVAQDLEFYFKAIADDLLQLGALHDRELDSETFARLGKTEFPGNLALVLTSEPALEASEMIRRALAHNPGSSMKTILDEMASDYADIYLVNALQSSPCESVWTDEDRLMMQQAMFDLRCWYEKHGLAASDWRSRPDDHLVCQLEFLAHLFRKAEGVDELKEAAMFLDAHLLCWLGGFSVRVANRCRTPFYAGIAMLTAAYVNELRELLGLITGVARPDPVAREAQEASSEEVLAYLPGMQPSW